MVNAAAGVDFWNGLRNKTLRVLVHEMMPYTSFVGPELTGYIGELWRDMEQTLGFKSEYRRTSFADGKAALQRAGGRDASDADADADVMLSPVVLESDDLHHFDAAGPVGSSIYSLYAVASEEDRCSSSAFYVWSWSRRLWLAYFAVLALFALMLRLASVALIPHTHKYTPGTVKLPRHFWTQSQPSKQNGATKLRGKSKSKRTSSGEKESNGPWTWGSCLLTVVRAATQQDLHLTTDGGPASHRLLVVVLLTFSSLLATSYSSVLVSRLTVAKDDPLFADLRSVAEDGRYFLCVRVNSPVYSKFLMANGSSSGELQPMWRPIVNRGPCHRQPTTTGHVAASICKERCVLFESDNIMSVLLANEEGCDMERPSPLRVYSHISILMRRGMPHARLIRLKIMTMKSGGSLQALQNRFLPISDRLITGRRAYQPITLHHVAAPLAGYAAAALAAAAVLGAELLLTAVFYRRRREAVGSSITPN